MLNSVCILLIRTFVGKMDGFSDILKAIRLKSAVYFRSDFSAPWGMEVKKGSFAQFHLVAQGQCVLKTGKSEIVLNTGDIVVFPSGDPHWLADSNTSERIEGKEVVQSIINTPNCFYNGAIATTLVCGHFEFDKSTDHPFLTSLPAVIHINNLEKKESRAMDAICDMIIDEANFSKTGSEAAVTKLAEFLFILVLRAYTKQQKDNNGFLGALNDTKISKALKLVHHQADKKITLDNLAKEAGMSRTLFATKFKKLVGQTPLTYITEWRILKAKEQLLETDETVGNISDSVGYQSEAAFNRVFKKKVGDTPAAFRRRHKTAI